jgi:hypothetical protein
VIVGCARRLQLTLVGMLALCVFPTSARADWLLVPFAGTAFGGQTALLNIENLEDGATSAKTVIGISGVWLSERVIGFEAELFYIPGFFESPGKDLIVDSYVSGVTGSVVLAVPLAITRESLRPYVAGGVGLTHGESNYTVVLPGESRATLASLQVGGGAIGFVTRRTGYRFDLRHLRSLSRGNTAVTGTRQNKLSFWRLSVGLVIRLG